MATERFTVRSSDGVEISVQKAGAGPSLLLVHGSLLNGALSWGLVLPKLAERFTVYAMDRRGRAPSGDATEYSIAREADDIAGVVQAIGGSLVLLAHSYGGLATLAALDRLTTVSHLILYEPPITLKPAETDVVSHMERALAAGDREQVVTSFLRDQVGVPVERIAMMRSSPIWPIALDLAHTLPRESHSVHSYRVPAERLANWKTPTTVLLGSQTMGMLREDAFFLRDAIPGCRLVTLEGQGHSAMLDAPEFFVSKLLEIA